MTYTGREQECEKQEVFSPPADHRTASQGTTCPISASWNHSQQQSANGTPLWDCAVLPRDRAILGHNQITNEPGRDGLQGLKKISMMMCSTTRAADTTYSARVDVWIIEFVALTFEALAHGHNLMFGLAYSFILEYNYLTDTCSQSRPLIFRC